MTFSGVLKGPSSFKVKSPSFSAFRAVLLKLQCSYESPGGFDKRQNLTGLGWGPDTTDTAFWQAPRPCYCCGCCWPMAQALNREAWSYIHYIEACFHNSSGLHLYPLPPSWISVLWWPAERQKDAEMRGWPCLPTIPTNASPLSSSPAFCKDTLYIFHIWVHSGHLRG